MRQGEKSLCDIFTDGAVKPETEMEREEAEVFTEG